MKTSRELFLFLDIDGVLNSKKFLEEQKGVLDPILDMHELYYPLDPKKISILNKIIELLESENFVVSLILSSYWRLEYSTDEITEFLREKGYTGPDIADCTDLLDHRGKEILEYIQRHRKIVKNILILDDDLDVFKISESFGRWVYTDWKEGLQENHIPYALKCASNPLAE